MDGWESLPGATISIEPGIHDYTLVSDCLSQSGKFHVRASLETSALEGPVYSDLHYVIVETTVPCP